MTRILAVHSYHSGRGCADEVYGGVLGVSIIFDSEGSSPSDVLPFCLSEASRVHWIMVDSVALVNIT